MFNNDITQTYNHNDATFEILIMLAGAFLLGFLLSWLTNKFLNKDKNTTVTANQNNEEFITFADLNKSEPQKKTFKDKDTAKSADTKHSIRAIEKEYQSALHEKPYTRPRIDDLTKISGISSALETKLKENGIKSFTDLRDVKRQSLVESLNLSKEDLISKEVQFWPHQASLAAKGEWKKLSEYQLFLQRTVDRNASSRQNKKLKKHDDLTRIEGVGPKIEEILNSNKITTYKDLMKSDRETLKSYLDEEGSRFEKNEPETWPLQAGMAERGEWEELKIYQEFMDDDSSFFIGEVDSPTTTNTTPLEQVSLNTDNVSDSDSDSDKKPIDDADLSPTTDTDTSSEQKEEVEAKTSEITDDLKKIDGIGPKIQEILNNKGISTYQDLRKSDPVTLKTYLDEAGSQFKLHEPDTWPRQAGYAEKGEWRQLDEYQDFMQGVREASLESEPLPIHGTTSETKTDDVSSSIKNIADDLKRIEGIGPKIEELLHKAGITTFEKLQDCNSATIKDLLDTAGPQFKMHNPDTWPHQAKMAFKGDWEKLEEYQDFLLGGRE